jgi:hypothetical protein
MLESTSLLRQWAVSAPWLQADSDDLKLVGESSAPPANGPATGARKPGSIAAPNGCPGAARFARREDFRRRLGEEGTAYLMLAG